MKAIKIGASSLALCLGLALAACETPTTYEPMPAAKLVSHATAQRPSFTVGDEFWFNVNGNTILVEEYLGIQDGYHAFRRALENETILFTPDMSEVRVERAFVDDEVFEPDNGRLEFPLAVNNTWTRKYRVRSEGTVFETERTRTCEVLDFGQAQTQAGEFLVYRIACTLTQLGDATVSQDELLYAPDVGRIINQRRLGSGTSLTLIEHNPAAQ